MTYLLNFFSYTWALSPFCNSNKNKINNKNTCNIILKLCYANTYHQFTKPIVVNNKIILTIEITHYN